MGLVFLALGAIIMGPIPSAGFVNNKGTDQPAHPRSLIIAVCYSLFERVTSRLATSEI